jgi:FtsH-binding integral membrane protein
MRYEMAPMAIQAERSERAAFIRRTYAHLAGAILAFVAVETLLFTLLQDTLTDFMVIYFQSHFSHLILLVGFIGSSYLARHWATNGGSQALQYAGLGLFILAEAVIFVPLLYVAMVMIGDVTMVGQAGILTMCLFAGLTSVVFLTRKDFSFLGPIIMIGSFLALGVILCVMIFGSPFESWGLWFALAMIVLAAGAILYDTSNIMLHYRTDQHVAAALSLFSSVALLFYYVLLALMGSRRN